MGLKELLDAATPGPWRKHGNSSQVLGRDGQIIGHFIVGRNVKNDTRLIARAPDMAAALIEAEKALSNLVAASDEMALTCNSGVADEAIDAARSTLATIRKVTA